MPLVIPIVTMPIRMLAIRAARGGADDPFETGLGTTMRAQTGRSRPTETPSRPPTRSRHVAGAEGIRKHPFNGFLKNFCVLTNWVSQFIKLVLLLGS